MNGLVTSPVADVIEHTQRFKFGFEFSVFEYASFEFEFEFEYFANFV